MDYAIIAAGKGSRMVSEGEQLPKPLVKIGGVPMIRRIIDAFVSCGASKVHIIINEEMSEVEDYLKGLTLDVELNVVVKNTTGSMMSFYELSNCLQSDCFCLSTVDSVFNADEFKVYINEFTRNRDADGYMAVTSFIDDEIPLYVGVGNDGLITCFSDTLFPDANVVSGGIYLLNREALNVLDACVKNGITDMREYQRQLLVAGLALRAYQFGKIVDVDHVQDIATANEFIKELDKE